MTVDLRDTPAITLLRRLVHANQTLERWAAAESGALGVSPGEFDVVMALGNTAGMRMCDIASHMLTSAPNVTRLVKMLEDRGYVARARNPDNDREVIAQLTPAGTALFERAYPRMYKAISERFGDLFDERQQAQLIELLGKLETATVP